jgi:uncharacterized protein (TIGR00251 family)
MGKRGAAIRRDALDLTETEGGIRLRLRVKAGGRGNAVLGTHAGALKVSVTAAPEKGKANRALIALLAERLDLPTSSIELLSGAGSPDKVVRIPLDADELLRRLSPGDRGRPA